MMRSERAVPTLLIHCQPQPARMNKFLYRLIRTSSILLFVFGGYAAHAQQFSISDGTISTCSGVLEDTGGPSGEYGNNENFTVTICPNVPGDAISLNWAVFALSNQGPNPKDRIRLWDGDNTSATFLGEYYGTDLQGLITSTTNMNSTGCITVQFISNAIGTGNFAAGITCFTPCERPTAVATMSEPAPYPALICVGEPVNFDGTGSYAAPTFNITDYTWVFDDGDSAHTSTATHSFSAPGEYIVQLNLIDDNGCVNSNVVDLQIHVGTTPSFAGTIESLETCLGSVVDLTAVMQPTTWTGIPEANFGDGVYLPDDLGIPFTSDLTFTQFDPGQTVTNTSDILSVCVNMEHSFMGDLVIQLTCPDGQTMLMHQQNGGGTYIGGANDGDSNQNPVAGTCWNYCWSPHRHMGHVGHMRQLRCHAARNDGRDPAQQCIDPRHVYPGATLYEHARLPAQWHMDLHGYRSMGAGQWLPLRLVHQLRSEHHSGYHPVHPGAWLHHRFRRMERTFLDVGPQQPAPCPSLAHRPGIVRLQLYGHGQFRLHL